MSESIYKLTRQIAIVCSLGISVYWLFHLDFVRAVANLILLIFFLYTSILFQNKCSRISVSYLFVFINLYFVYSASACYFTVEEITKLDMTGFLGWGKEDFYYIYFWGVLLSYIPIIVYLKCFCKRKEIKKHSITFRNDEKKNLYLGMILLLGIYFILGRQNVVLFPMLSILIAYVIFDKRNRIFHMILVLMVCFLFRNIFLSRYQLIQVVLPIILAYIFISKYNEKKMSMWKIYGFFLFGLVIVGIYGVISEVYKLNTAYDGQYNIADILLSLEEMGWFFVRQFYRLFVVVIKIGGYLIYHTKKYGFYFGITYVKAFSNVLGIDYVSLPVICAEYNYSTYAQPGLLAEGYSNFGIIGIVVNILLVFFLMEYLRHYFYKKPSMTNLLLMTVPFSKILLDGGSFNSALILIAFFGVINILNILNRMRWKSNDKYNSSNV